MKLTIFTPTYNRAYILPKLYESLKSQSNKNFIWLIVDDGSTDDTEDLVNNWIKEEQIKIQYFKQSNQGKSIAHNKGVSLTETELFTCVDSDDYLRNDAVELILKNWTAIKENNNVIGILALKGKPDSSKFTTIRNNIKYTTLSEGYRKHGLQGDSMLIYRSDIIKKYEFPKFEGEKFVPEAYLYDLLDQEGKLFILREIIYYYEYLEDGYTKNMAKLIKKNPKGYLTFIEQRLKFDRNLMEKVKNTIKYTAICKVLKKKNYIRKSVYPMITFFTWPIGLIFYFTRYKNVE